ncbi:unnamed protein product [Fusarium graminearum]|uniref:Chromosome 1, complete genome n=1 Tax=Gibberella zeae (strain ATCC MYA-4620 / CBS 123657 / FGSC 9075 / NRRL 31084 / PH-1) TaxID=229533 RepID=A0A098D1J6_GIBZE|nr:unnamed protein product [Fusarium graminearum]CZS76096.1 unnamed protein product [Fusarium graminearum]
MLRQSTTWPLQSRDHALSQDDTGATEQSGALCYACRALTWGDFILQRDETSGVPGCKAREPDLAGQTQTSRHRK